MKAKESQMNFKKVFLKLRTETALLILYHTITKKAPSEIHIYIIYIRYIYLYTPCAWVRVCVCVCVHACMCILIHIGFPFFKMLQEAFSFFFSCRFLFLSFFWYFKAGSSVNGWNCHISVLAKEINANPITGSYHLSQKPQLKEKKTTEMSK